MLLHELHSANDKFKYIGEELMLFAAACNWKKYVAQILQPLINGHVLEVGAGIGASTCSLYTGKEVSWTCLEPDFKLADRLSENIRKNCFPNSISVYIIIGIIAALPSDLMYDTILYIDVLEHIEDDSAELRNACKHLSFGGRLIVLSPAHQWLFSPFDRAIGHHRRYDRRTLKKAGPKNLRLTRIHYLDCVGLIVSFANRIFLRSSIPSYRQIQFWDGVVIPLSKLVDPLFGYQVGKTIIAVWECSSQ